MSKFIDPESKATEKTSSPHPDYRANLSYYFKMAGRVKFISPDIVSVLSKDGNGPNYIGLSLSWTENTYRMSTLISMHQNSYAFKEELCNVFNNLGNQGILKRLDNPKPKVDPDHKWGYVPREQQDLLN